MLWFFLYSTCDQLDYPIYPLIFTLLYKVSKGAPLILSEFWTFEPLSATGVLFFLYVRFGPVFFLNASSA